MEAKDFLLLGLGTALSIPASIIASWLAGPFLTVTWTYGAAVFFSRLLFWTSPKFLRTGDWEFTWHVESERFPKINSSPVLIHSFLNIVAAEWTATTTDGESIAYRMVATRSANKLTGKWFDKAGDEFGYVGALQLLISPTRTEAVGKWIGFSVDGIVKADSTVLRRMPRATAQS